MQVFKAFLKVLKKNSITAIVFIGVFLLVAVMMSANKADVGVTVEVRMSVFDEDGTPESEKLTEVLGKKFDIKDIRNDRETITDMLYYESIGYALVINKGYSEKLAAGETDGLFSAYHLHSSYKEVIAEQVVNDYAAAVSAYVSAGIPLSEAIDYAGNDLLTETDVTIERFDEGSKDYPSDFAAYFRYLPYILISAILSALCPVLMIMDRKDLRYRTNCSSIRQNSYTLQIFAGGAVFVLAVWLIFMGVGMYLYGGMFRGNAWTAVLNSALFALITAVTAVLVASIISTQNILTLIVQVLGLGSSFICGIFVPQYALSSGVLAVGRFFPAYWYVKLNDMLCGDTLYKSDEAAVCLLIELGYAAALLMITLLIRKLRYSGAYMMSKA